MVASLSKKEIPFDNVSVVKGVAAATEVVAVALESDEVASLKRAALEANAALEVVTKDRGPQDTRWLEVTTSTGDTISVPTSTKDKNGLRVAPLAGVSLQDGKAGVVAGAELQYNGKKFAVSVGGQWGQTTYADGDRYNTVATEAMAYYKLLSFGAWDTYRIWVGGGVRYTWQKTKTTPLINDKDEVVGEMSSWGNYFSGVAKVTFEFRPHQGSVAYQVWAKANFRGATRHNMSNAHNVGLEFGVSLPITLFGKTNLSQYGN